MIPKPARISSSRFLALQSFQPPVVSRYIVAVLLLQHHTFLQEAMAACYWRNGTENTHPAYAPRINDTSNPLSTICCASWDNLLPNGLCQNKDSSTIYRETCTKSSWEGGGCQELCSAEVHKARRLYRPLKLTWKRALRKETTMK